MKYTDVIRNYLASSHETIDSFAARSGVSRATFFKSMRGRHSPRLATIERLLASAGYRLEIVSTSSASSATCQTKQDA